MLWVVDGTYWAVQRCHGCGGTGFGTVCGCAVVVAAAVESAGRLLSPRCVGRLWEGAGPSLNGAWW